METQIWTVVQMAEGDCLPWNVSFPTLEAAEIAIRKEHDETWEDDEEKPEIRQTEGYNHEGQTRFETENGDVWFVTPTTLAK